MKRLSVILLATAAICAFASATPAVAQEPFMDPEGPAPMTAEPPHTPRRAPASGHDGVPFAALVAIFAAPAMTGNSADTTRPTITNWVDDYNQRRPHSALGYLTPAAYAATLSATCDPAAQPRPAPPIARCSTRAPRRKTCRGSKRRWMKVQGQVKAEVEIGTFRRHSFSPTLAALGKQSLSVEEIYTYVFRSGFGPILTPPRVGGTKRNDVFAGWPRRCALAFSGNVISTTFGPPFQI